MQAAIVVLFVHAFFATVLVVAGTVLISMHTISQGTFLAMVSGGVGLLSGGGTALAIVHSIEKDDR